MCRPDDSWFCSAKCLSSQVFPFRDNLTESMAPLDVPSASVMPPVSAKRLELPFLVATEKRLLALGAFCSVLIVIYLLVQMWRRKMFTTTQLNQCSKQIVTAPGKLIPMDAYSIYSEGPSTYFPPPPGSTLTARKEPMYPPLFQYNSGVLAAQAFAKEWQDPLLSPETHVEHPWRRHSHPPPKIVSEHGSTVTITHDADQYFEDPDLNGLWRRRTLEFS